MLGCLGEDPPTLRCWGVSLGRTHPHCDAGGSWRGPTPTVMLGRLREDPPPLQSWGILLGRTHTHCDAGVSRWGGPTPTAMLGVSERTHPHCNAGVSQGGPTPHPPAMLGVYGFSGCGSRAPGARASVAVACGLGCSAARGFFLDEGLNLCPLHWQADSYPLHRQGGRDKSDNKATNLKEVVNKP